MRKILYTRISVLPESEPRRQRANRPQTPNSWKIRHLFSRKISIIVLVVLPSSPSISFHGQNVSVYLLHREKRDKERGKECTVITGGRGWNQIRRYSKQRGASLPICFLYVFDFWHCQTKPNLQQMRILKQACNICKQWVRVCFQDNLSNFKYFEPSKIQLFLYLE